MVDPYFVQDHEEPELWAAEQVSYAPGRPPIHIMMQTAGEAPTAYGLRNLKTLLGGLEQRIEAAAELLLENYSRDDWLEAGVPADQLPPGDSVPAMVRQATLRALWLFDEDAEDYELWFTLPWDDEHTYDVEFQGGEPVACSVND
ncbi:hypothetical protein [Achromobacter aloeverae]|uniref:DUF2262 domain-containing protein n=1 Tax=Achromobacter aloeverae TaxID=1750518 RepID=A0A4Q1HCB0_9BURK|nr:hypothetical protein [Achromobacter aloeverae]RXN83224.1 hypothetical protein C7R54_27405 [Achromobacter aloeverae]